MIGLTLVAVVAAVFHPIAWTDEEMRLAVIAPAALGALIFFGALALGRLDATLALGPVSVTPLLAAIALAAGSLVVYGLFRLGGGLGYGPLAVEDDRNDPDRVLEPPAPAPTGWLRPGAFVGLPLVWAAACLVAIPLAVYVVSYIPWALIENHRLWDGVPAGHTGQTLLDLTFQMYGYHNSLPSAHAASSPWWAWPFDLKPVWFYQDSMAGGTSAAVYDAGNLVIWWLGVPALIFASIMAFRRRSLGAGAHHHRVRRPMGLVGAHRPGRVPVPLLHGPAVRDPRPRLPHRRVVARGVTPDVAGGPPGRRGGRRGARRPCGCSHGRCAPSWACRR